MPCNAAPLKMRLWNPKTSTTISISTGRRRTGTRKRSAWTGTKNKPAPSPASSELPQRFEPESRHRLEEAAQLQRPHRIGIDELRDLVLGLRVEQDLAGARLAAQPRRQVGHVADRGVLPALLEADHAQRRFALRDADAQADLVA